MILWFVAMSVAAPNAAQERLAVYAVCVSQQAASFKKTDLSGDSTETIIRAAEIACRRERQDFVNAVETFTRTRHPDLGPGSRAKVTDLFVRMREQGLEAEVTSRIAGGGNQ